MLPCTNLAGFTGESSGILGFEESSDGTGMLPYIALFPVKEPVVRRSLFDGALKGRATKERPQSVAKTGPVRVSLTLPVELSVQTLLGRVARSPSSVGVRHVDYQFSQHGCQWP